MQGRSQGVLALVGALALYGAYSAIDAGRIKLNKYGDDQWLSWADSPFGFGAAVVSLLVVGSVLMWIAWRQWRNS